MNEQANSMLIIGSYQALLLVIGKDTVSLSLPIWTPDAVTFWKCV
jgi:hypothetical protein